MNRAKTSQLIEQKARQNLAILKSVIKKFKKNHCTLSIM